MEKKRYKELQVSNKAWQYQPPKIPTINFTDRFLELVFKNSLCQRPNFYKPEFQILPSSKQINIKHQIHTITIFYSFKVEKKYYDNENYV